MVGILEKFKALFRRKDALAFPETIAPEESSAERRQRTRLNAREGTRVLIIDDSKTILAVLKKFLRSAGYDTIEALDAESGLELMRQHRPQLVFLDIMLPGMNGFAALRQIRRDQQLRDTPVIMMSGNEQAMEKFFGTRIGADDFMKKPFSRYEVFFRIERLLDENLIPKRLPPPSALGPASRPAP